MKFRRFLFLLLCCSGVAEAAGYAGLSLGSSRSGIRPATLTDGSLISNVDIGDKVTTYSLHAGVRNHNNLGFEISYSDLGAPHIRGDSDGNGLYWRPGPASITYRTSVLHLDGVAYSKLIANIDLHGRVGLYRAATKMILDNDCCRRTLKTYNSGFLIGLGVTANILQRTWLQLKWARFQAVNNGTGYNANPIDSVSLGLSRGFD